MAYAKNTPDHVDQKPERPSRNQKDLFNLSGTGTSAETGYHLKTIQHLAREGIRVIPAGPGHWILRGRQPLPEIHCYSEQELQRFAHSRARHYLTSTHRETP